MPCKGWNAADSASADGWPSGRPPLAAPPAMQRGRLAQACCRWRARRFWPAVAGARAADGRPRMAAGPYFLWAILPAPGQGQHASDQPSGHKNQGRSQSQCFARYDGTAASCPAAQRPTGTAPLSRWWAHPPGAMQTRKNDAKKAEPSCTQDSGCGEQGCETAHAEIGTPHL